jgi:hypothetical protein
MGSGGTTGSAGAIGSGGTTGSAGTTGSGGTYGGAGATGTAGRGGVTGSAGSGGAAGGSGAAGNGGSGGNGAVTLDAKNLLADFEDPVAVVTMSGSPARNGQWYAYNDGSSTCIETPAADTQYATAVPPTFDGTPNNTRALHAQWTGCFIWGAGVGSDLNVPIVAGGVYTGPRVPYDLTGYTGITFWARSASTADNMLRVKLLMTDETRIADGGNCNEADPAIGSNMCSDSWGKLFALPTNGAWQQIAVNFADLSFKQEGWGHIFPWNPAHVIAINFQSQDAEVGQLYDFWLDDVYLTK